VPVGLLEVLPQKLQWRIPAYRGRSDLECLLASDSATDWVRISEMLLGPAPPSFRFMPKHASNSYSSNGLSGGGGGGGDSAMAAAAAITGPDDADDHDPDAQNG
jgi:tRNA-dihydrouridine synthase 3